MPFGESGDGSDVVILEARSGSIALRQAGDDQVVPEVVERRQDGQVEGVDAVEGNRRQAVGLNRPRRSSVAAVLRYEVGRVLEGLVADDVARVLVLVHVQQRVYALL